MLGFTKGKNELKPFTSRKPTFNEALARPNEKKISKNKSNKNNNPMVGTGPTLTAASKKKRPPKKLTEKQITQKSRKLNDNKDITVETTFTLNPDKDSIKIVKPTTYNVKIRMKGHARVISQKPQTVEETEPEGDSYAKYEYHINKLLLEHIDLTKEGINDTLLTKKGKQIKLLKKIQQATKPKINADIETWLKNLGVKVTFIKGTKKVGDNNPTTFKKGKRLTTKPRLQDDMSAEEYLGETLFLGLKF